jgi:hypothetical protein
LSGNVQHCNDELNYQLWRWWKEQDDFMKAKVKKLVSTGQLEFINGGWVMNGEHSNR